MAKILVTEAIDESGILLLKEAGHQVIEANRVQAVIQKEIADADAVIVRVVPLDAKILSTAKNLKLISKHGVGIDNIDQEYCKQHGIAVTVTPDANGQSVAEHAFALMLSLAKKLTPIADAYRTCGFDTRNKMTGSELFGKTVGVIGYGRIGKRFAKMCGLGFDMKVLAYDPFVKEAPDYVQLVDMDTLLRQSDYISIHTVLQEGTTRLISAEALSKMKKNAVLINVSRGPMVDELALIEALQNGQIGGAGLDVSDPEPMAFENPLFCMNNVIVTPHFAACTDDAARRVSTIACENVINFCAGREVVGKMV